MNNSNTPFFKRFSDRVSGIVGSPYWFFFSVVVILVWLPSGVFFEFNEIWHLIINTFTTIFTFLMMSLLHSSQNEWEQKMEKLQKQQERTLKLLEKRTNEIKSNLEGNEDKVLINEKTVA